ncbi:hypothetical protein H4W34_006829 [Actinomadura algeriensis]|uniref:PKD domain-containing protein n=2 Tax=Actinomadura algeriensis TaxID=1679523 RepID=A0ABR9K2B0_9ACTN|nr:hypothetical protein [Actinomadura algeriensis]
MGERFDDSFRLWYYDNADHLEGPVTGTKASRIVEYTGFLQQALRDVSAWAEKGIRPNPSTRYELSGGQVAVPAKAAARRGVQPVVDLTANGADRIDVRAGETVTFKAEIQVPPGAGKVVSTEWDFRGEGAFDARPFGPVRRSVEVMTTFTYDTPGTYIAALRATAQRDGNAQTPFARMPNLGRARVTVH